jgi:ornithine cyclodeaminase/alanine dehydrogenase-like protein (mu-crystallin family)
LFVETRDATFEPPPVGCAELQGVDPATSVELGEVVNGTRPGRSSGAEITVYKAMGHVIEDIVAADIAYRTAVERGVGQCLQM